MMSRLATLIAVCQLGFALGEVQCSASLGSCHSPQASLMQVKSMGQKGLVQVKETGGADSRSQTLLNFQQYADQLVNQYLEGRLVLGPDIVEAINVIIGFINDMYTHMQTAHDMDVTDSAEFQAKAAACNASYWPSEFVEKLNALRTKKSNQGSAHLSCRKALFDECQGQSFDAADWGTHDVDSNNDHLKLDNALNLLQSIQAPIQAFLPMAPEAVPTGYIHAGSNCNCGARISRSMGYETADACSQQCTPDLGCKSFGLNNQDSKKAGRCTLWDSACLDTCSDPTDVAAGYTNKVYNKATTYHLAPAGATTCDTGSTPAEEDCESAADELVRALGHVQTHQDLVVDSWSNVVPSGCSVDSNREPHGGNSGFAAHYNRNPQSGNSGFALVCSNPGQAAVTIEQAAEDSGVDHCAVYDQYRQENTAASLPSCAPAKLADDYIQGEEPKLGEMEGCLEDMKTWLDPLYELFDKCDRQKTQCEAKPGECKKKQQDYEFLTCEYNLQVQVKCEGYTTCFNDVVSDSTVDCTNINIRAAARSADNETAERIKCLLGVLMLDKDDTTTDEDGKEVSSKADKLAGCKDVSYTEYNANWAIACPTGAWPPQAEYPAGLDCAATDASGTETRPEVCDNQFLAQEYEGYKFPIEFGFILAPYSAQCALDELVTQVGHCRSCYGSTGSHPVQ